MDPYYPPVAFRFKLGFSDITTAGDAAFQEVSGISAELGVEEIAEGGENRFKYRIPSAAKFNNLVLKRGLLTETSQLAKWCSDTVGTDFSTAIETKTIVVTLLDEEGNDLAVWNFYNAWPIKWSMADFKAMDNGIAIETMEFAFNYFKRK